MEQDDKTLIDNTRQTFFSPEDDTVSAYLDFIKKAKYEVLIADYSFNLKPLVDLLVQMHKTGINIRLVLDRTQAAGPTEKPEVFALKDAGLSMMIGTSSQRKIMHDKFTIVDREWVQSGSWNYTEAASKEDNFFDIEHSTDRAKQFMKAFERMWTWIGANEAQPA